MKAYLSPLAVLVGSIAAQSLSDLPACGQTCVNNMVSIGPSLGCDASDNGQSSSACLCASEDFAFGIRDCSNQSCPAGTDLSSINAYAIQYCQDAQSSASAAGTPSATLSALSIFSSNSGGEATATGSETGTGAAATSSDTSASAVTTLPVVSTGSETTIGSSTLLSNETSSLSSGATAVTAGSNATTTGAAGGSSSNSTESGGATNVSTSAVSTVPVVSTLTSGSMKMTTTVGSSTVYSTISSQGMAAPAWGWAHQPMVTGLAELGAFVVAGAFML